MKTRARFGRERFERLYEADPDPWDYGSSDYEDEKYARTLDAIGPGPFGRVLEVGCSIGVFTERLAPLCRELVAIDFSHRALELARERLEEHDNVEIVHASFPEDVPEGPWDLIICSEVLYYLDRPGLGWAIAWLRTQLHLGADVVVVNWRGEGANEPFGGEEVHERLQRELARWHAHDDRQPGYVLDRFESDGDA